MGRVWSENKEDWTELPPDWNETRYKDPETGGEKGQKPARMASAPAYALEVLAKVYGHGAEKYAPHNYRKGYPWSLSIDALWRHLLLFQDGEDLDPESGYPHMAHVAWHALTLVQFMADHPEKDDRYKESDDGN